MPSDNKGLVTAFFCAVVLVFKNVIALFFIFKESIPKLPNASSI